MRAIGFAAALAGAVFFSAATADAGSYDAKAHNKVVIERSGATCADDPNCFNRLHPAIPMVARAKPGQLIVFETRDAADTDFNLDTRFPRDLKTLHRSSVHPLSGPVFIGGRSGGTCWRSPSSTSRPANTGSR